MALTPENRIAPAKRSLQLSRRALRLRSVADWIGQAILFTVTLTSALAVLFIFFFIARDALPFFQARGLAEFLGSTKWYPTAEEPSFGALAIFVGSGLVTLGATAIAVPLGVSAAVCLSDVVPFGLRQWIKPVVEVLAAIPSVAFGFFALIVFAPLLQSHGGVILAVTWWCIGIPIGMVLVLIAGDVVPRTLLPRSIEAPGRLATMLLAGVAVLTGVILVGLRLLDVQVSSGTNALNVSVILGIMALPTIISVSEDALQAAGRELREGAYALGSTRAETLMRVVIPAAGSGICAAVILGIMRAIGETMVVWMASGNASQIPEPWYDLTEPVRTLTATIAGDMGEADHVTGSARYHVLFAMALALLTISFVCNLVSERVIARSASRSH